MKILFDTRKASRLLYMIVLWTEGPFLGENWCFCLKIAQIWEWEVPYLSPKAHP